MPSVRKSQTMRDLEYVLKLCEEIERGGRGAFRRIAETVNENPSAITIAVNRVEKYVGRPLLETTEKGSRAAKLTSYGKAYLKCCPEVISAWDCLELAIAEAENSTE
jgi:DNA-binding transcriptional LysR family regulator